MVLDIGSRSTNLVFIEEGKVFYRSIPVAGNTITQEIAKALKLFRPDVDGAGTLTSPKIGEAEAVDDGIVAVTVTLTMKAEL